MGNPWKEVSLADYESHMSLESVYQLQTLNGMMKEQLSFYEAESVMILGIAGGNGLEHIDRGQYTAVYGVDVNPDYLKACQERYTALGDILIPVCADLTDEKTQLPCADLLIANLLIEYIGYECFRKVVQKVKPKAVSCVIQINTGTSFVSESPYVHAFDKLFRVHHQMEENELIASMQKIGYRKTVLQRVDLPNGKQFVRMDFST